MNWVKACDTSSCVEVAVTYSMSHVRNSAMPGVWVSFTLEEWDNFIRGVKDGKFDPPEEA